MNSARDQIKRGIWWVGASSAAVRVLDALAMLIVVRLLTEVEFGIAALASAVTAVVEATSGLGVGTALIRADKLEQRQLSSLFWFSVGVALSVGAVVALAGPWIATAYVEPALWPLLLLPAVKLVVVAAGLVPQQLLIRELRFREAGAIQAGAMGVEAFSKVVLVLAGLGAWALLLAELFRAVAAAIAAFRLSRFFPRLHCSLSEIRWFVGFGWRTSLSTLATECYKNLDYFLIGRLLGMSAVGVYRLAFYVTMTTADSVAQPLYRVTYPVFARLATRAKLTAAFIDASRYLLTLVLPISVFLFVSGEDLLRVTTAERWLAAAPALRVLCWAGVLRALTRLFDNFFFALSRPALALLDAALSLLVLGTALPLLLHFAGDTLGILAAAYAWLLTYPIVFGVLFVLARRMTPLRFTNYSRELAPVLLGASVMGLCLATINASVSEADVWLRLFLTAGVGLGSYALALRLLRSVRMGDLR